ncbi:MAG: GerW family sporulation protein [Candidatus Avilachnospira sp.]|jgi:uncharacterized spore protein YtfJ
MAADINCKINDDGMGVTLEALFKGMEGLVSSKTVVGDPIKAGGATLIPIIEVSAGMAAGELNSKGKKNAGAMSTKISPVAMLIIQDGKTKLINIKNQDTLTKILDMVPEAIDKITGGSRVGKDAEEAAKEYLDEAKADTEISE